MTAIATYIQNGEHLDYVPTVDLPGGAVVPLPDAVAIAPRPIPANTLGALTVCGVYALPRDPAGLIPLGKRLYWDIGLERASTSPTDGGGVANPPLGLCAKPSPDAATALWVRLGR